MAWIQTANNQHSEDNKTATLLSVAASLWRAQVEVDSLSFFAGYWITLSEAQRACEVWARILQVQADKD